MKAQIALLFAVVVLFVTVLGQSESRQVYCGRNLANVMAALCFTKYDKRSDYNSLRLSYDPEYSWPWLSRTSEHRHGQDRVPARDITRGKRGIIEDCCEQSCTIETLLTYC